MKRITPMVSMAFKKIFGVEENKDLLISLLNSIVSEKDYIIKYIYWTVKWYTGWPNDQSNNIIGSVEAKVVKIC